MPEAALAMSRSGGKATENPGAVPLADDVSTYRGEGRCSRGVSRRRRFGSGRRARSSGRGRQAVNPLAGRGWSRTSNRLLATVLFSDIVGSTERAVELGDRRWRQLIAAHHSFVRKQLKRFGGREVDTAGVCWKFDS